MNQTVIDDPFASASNPQTFSSDLWGRVEIQAWFCVLEKGYGRVPFNPSQHNAGQKRTAIDVSIDPLPELNITNMNVCERHLLAESKEWRTITLKSLQNLGYQDVRSANGKWAHVAPVPNGRTYEKDGQMRDSTDFKFLAIYNTEAECRAAMNGGNGAQPPSPAQYEPTGVPINETEKQAAAQFLRVIVTNAIAGKQPAQYREAITASLAGFPMVNKFFTFDSPEVQALLK